MCGEYVRENDTVKPGTTIVGRITCDTLGLSCEIFRDDLEGYVCGEYAADGDGEVTAVSIDAIPEHAGQFAAACDHWIRRALADAGPGYRWHEITPGGAIGRP